MSIDTSNTSSLPSSSTLLSLSVYSLACPALARTRPPGTRASWTGSRRRVLWPGRLRGRAVVRSRDTWAVEGWWRRREARLLKDESGIAMRSVHGHCPSTKTCLASISVHQPLKSRSASRARNEKLSLLLLDLEPQLHRLPAHATPRGHWSVMRPCQ